MKVKSFAKRVSSFDIPKPMAIIKVIGNVRKGLEKYLVKGKPIWHFRKRKKIVSKAKKTQGLEQTTYRQTWNFVESGIRRNRRKSRSGSQSGRWQVSGLRASASGSPPGPSGRRPPRDRLRHTRSAIKSKEKLAQLFVNKISQPRFRFRCRLPQDLEASFLRWNWRFVLEVRKRFRGFPP